MNARIESKSKKKLSDIKKQLVVMFTDYTIEENAILRHPEAQKEAQMVTVQIPSHNSLIQYLYQNKFTYIYEINDNVQNSDVVNKFFHFLDSIDVQLEKLSYIFIAFHFYADLKELEPIIYHMYPTLALFLDSNVRYLGSQFNIHYQHPYHEGINMVVRLAQPTGAEAVFEINTIQQLSIDKGGRNDYIKDIAQNLLDFCKNNFQLIDDYTYSL